MTKRLLHGAGVAAILEEMCGERAPERVTRRTIRKARREDGEARDVLHDRLVQVVAALLSGLTVRGL